MYRTKTGPLALRKWLLLVNLALLPLTACQRPTPLQQRYLQFGTLIDVSLATTDETRSEQLFGDIEQLLKQRHHQWHGWEDGDLSRFNRALLAEPGHEVTIPASLRLLIDESQRYYDLSDGLFNPALGKLIGAWGFHASQQPDFTLIAEIKKDIPGMHDLVINGEQAHSTNPYLQLDFGAIAKGLAVRQMADLLISGKLEDFIINAGGDVYAHGDKIGQPWRVAVEDPFAAEQQNGAYIATLEISQPTSVFTSGNYRRYYIDSDNRRRHHIIDPRSGEPSTRISAVTVLHPDPLVADVAATTLMLTPVDRIKQMASRFGISEFLVINEQRDLYITSSLNDRLHWRNKQAFKIHLL